MGRSPSESVYINGETGAKERRSSSIEERRLTPLSLKAKGSETGLLAAASVYKVSSAITLLHFFFFQTTRLGNAFTFVWDSRRLPMVVLKVMLGLTRVGTKRRPNA